MGLGTEMIEGGHLDLRQGRVPKETEAHHHQRQPPKVLGKEHPAEGQGGGQRAQLHDAHAPPGVIGDPGPHIGRHDPGHHHQGHQLADGGGDITQTGQIQGPVRDKGPQRGVVKEIETGEPPVRDRHRVHVGHPVNRTTTSRRYSGAPGARAGITGVCEWTSRFWARWRNM